MMEFPRRNYLLEVIKVNQDEIQVQNLTWKHSNTSINLALKKKQELNNFESHESTFHHPSSSKFLSSTVTISSAVNVSSSSAVAL